MSEAVARVRQPIDLDEFERRLRAGEISSRAEDDPVAELARLVGHADPFRMPVAAPHVPIVAPQLRPAADRHQAADRRQAPTHLQQVHPAAEQVMEEPHPSYADDIQSGHYEPAARDDQSAHYEQSAHHEPAAHYEQPAYYDESVGHRAATHVDYDDAPQLRGALHGDTADTWQHVPLVEAANQSREAGHDAQAAAFAEQGVLPAAVIAAQEPPRRSWRGVIILSTILATGFAGLAAALTMKGSFLVASKSAGPITKGGIPVILAGGPTKVQPPKSSESADDQTSILDKTGSLKPAAAKVVNNVEQPVDLSQQRPKAVRAAFSASSAAGLVSGAASPQPAPSPPPRQILASLEPSVPHAPPAQSVASPPPVVRGSTEEAPPVGAAGFPTPKRVKVISVRPDGSVIGGEHDAAEPVAPLEPIAPSAAAPAAAAPESAAPASAAAAPSRGNDAVAALIDRGHADGAAPATADRSAGAKPEDRLAITKPRHGKTKPTEVADLAGDAGRGNDAGHTGDAARASGGDGSFAAQLAAAPSESAAKSTLRRLQKKYGSALGGHRLSYHRVRVGGKTVFRVRLSSLSKEDADSVCSKLQAAGGSCFVANN